MNPSLQVFLHTSAMVLTVSVLAQDPAKPAAPYTSTTRPAVPESRAERLNGAIKASDLIGMTVQNYQDETLGKINDLVVDVESGRVVQVIVSTGGFLGLGDTLTAVPPGAFHQDAAGKLLHLNADKNKLANSPAFVPSKWAECCDSNRLSTVYHHYGQERYFTFLQEGEVVRGTQVGGDVAGATALTRATAGTPGERRAQSYRQSLIPVTRLSQLQPASKVMSTPVKNLQDEKLGKVEDLLVDLGSGRVIAVVVSSGGFLGMGDALSAVPPTALRFTTERDTLQLDASKEMLRNAPHFTGDRWPDFRDAAYAGGVYRAYHVEPYFAGDEPVSADNAARNVRDRNERTLTPLDQGNSQADVDTTAHIRKDIMAGKDMSVNARNVKIITIAGRVTLRGPVNSAEEKRLIGEIAARIARFENVDNQLEVTRTTTSTK